MAKVTPSNPSRRGRPALNPEARENQVISLAYDLAEQQIRDGTASSQVITHFLKMGSSKERAERQLQAVQMELMEAKKKAIADQAELKDLYADALKAMRNYSGNGDPDDYEN